MLGGVGGVLKVSCSNRLAVAIWFVKHSFAHWISITIMHALINLLHSL